MRLLITLVFAVCSVSRAQSPLEPPMADLAKKSDIIAVGQITSRRSVHNFETIWKVRLLDSLKGEVPNEITLTNFYKPLVTHGGTPLSERQYLLLFLKFNKITENISPSDVHFPWIKLPSSGAARQSTLDLLREHIRICQEDPLNVPALKTHLLRQIQHKPLLEFSMAQWRHLLMGEPETISTMTFEEQRQLLSGYQKSKYHWHTITFILDNCRSVDSAVTTSIARRIVKETAKSDDAESFALALLFVDKFSNYELGSGIKSTNKVEDYYFNVYAKLDITADDMLARLRPSLQ